MYEDFVDIFLGSSQNVTIFRGLCTLGSFLKVNLQNRGYFWGLLKFQIFFGVLEIPDIFFGVNARCWVRAYVFVALSFSRRMIVLIDFTIFPRWRPQ